MELKEKKIMSETIFEGHILTLQKDTVLCPNGNITTREVARHAEAAAMLVIRDDKVLIERQYRYPYDEIMLEIPAGKMDEGETPLQTAKRELEEETGYCAHEMTYLGKIYPSCGFTDEIIHLFLAQNLEECQKHWDENERLELLWFSIDELKSLILEGKITDAKTICALQFYFLQQERNKKEEK